MAVAPLEPEAAARRAGPLLEERGALPRARVDGRDGVLAGAADDFDVVRAEPAEVVAHEAHEVRHEAVGRAHDIIIISVVLYPAAVERVLEVALGLVADVGLRVVPVPGQEVEELVDVDRVHAVGRAVVPVVVVAVFVRLPARAAEVFVPEHAHERLLVAADDHRDALVGRAAAAVAEGDDDDAVVVEGAREGLSGAVRDRVDRRGLDPLVGVAAVGAGAEVVADGVLRHEDVDGRVLHAAVARGREEGLGVGVVRPRPHVRLRRAVRLGEVVVVDADDGELEVDGGRVPGAPVGVGRLTRAPGGEGAGERREESEYGAGGHHVGAGVGFGVGSGVGLSSQNQ